MTQLAPEHPRQHHAELVEPVAGPLFQAAARTSLPSGKRDHERKRLLALLAAYQDAGHNPSIREVALRLGPAVGDYLTGSWHKRARRIDNLLRGLERDGVLVVHWPSPDQKRRQERNRYELRLDGVEGHE